MQRRFWRGATLAILMGFALSLVACGQVGKLQGKKAFKEANVFYQQQEYKKAAERYEEAVKADPELSVAYFYLGNSYDNLYKPSRKGEAENDGVPDQGHRELQEGRRQGNRSEDAPPGARSTSWRPTVPTRSTTRRRPSRSCSA